MNAVKVRISFVNFVLYLRSKLCYWIEAPKHMYNREWIGWVG